MGGGWAARVQRRGKMGKTQSRTTQCRVGDHSSDEHPSPGVTCVLGWGGGQGHAGDPAQPMLWPERKHPLCTGLVGFSGRWGSCPSAGQEARSGQGESLARGTCGCVLEADVS